MEFFAELVPQALDPAAALVLVAAWLLPRRRVLGWSLGFERRKAFAGTAVFDAEGTLVACAQAIWIAI